jgi:hypothetical protein
LVDLREQSRGKVGKGNPSLTCGGETESQPRLSAEALRPEGRTLTKSSEKDSIYIPVLNVRVSICKDMVLTTFQIPMSRSAPGRWVRKGRSEASKMKANEGDGDRR